MRDNSSEEGELKEKFNILDVDRIKVNKKEDEAVSEEELNLNKKAAGRLKKNDKGEMVIEVREE